MYIYLCIYTCTYIYIYIYIYIFIHVYVLMCYYTIIILTYSIRGVHLRAAGCGLRGGVDFYVRNTIVTMIITIIITITYNITVIIPMEFTRLAETRLARNTLNCN